MIDATRILDLLVGGQALAPFGNPQQPPQQQQTPPQQPGAPADLLERARGMLGVLTNGVTGGGFGGGLAGGVAAGAITSLLLGSKAGREFAGDALKLGAAAALGGLAYRAYSNYRSNQPVGSGGSAAIGTSGSAAMGANTAGASVPSVPPSTLPAPTPANDHALLLVRAMIAAALSDGTLDATERAHIIGRLTAAGIDPTELAFLDAEIARPFSPNQFAAAAPGPEQRAEIYLASALAIDADTDAERAYLRYLAATLQLDDKLIAHLEDAVRGAKSQANAPPKRLAAG
jgi:uncharacterized membrane protein YebE (DUF533 family)